MNSEDIKKAVINLGTWKKDGKMSPHKPLLTLYALGRLLNEGIKWIPYIEIKRDMKELLSRFSNSNHPEYPYVYLRNDGYWEVNQEIDKKITIKQLNNTSGGFTKEVHALLLNNPSLIEELTSMLLEYYFAETQYDDLLNSTGLMTMTIKKRPRSPLFRKNVLETYGYRCAVCGFNLHLNHSYVGLEAAHIKWHKYGGPDKEENGLALCSLHHTLFDYGSFTIHKNNILVVSSSALSYGDSSKLLFGYHGQEILKPYNPNHSPNKLYLEWHNDEIFKKPARYLEKR
ncbi:phosphorothioated DNA-binding restriction endonuclease [Paenibacillus sp. ISL-20]|uniref:phosphorothioated DNA-binding restriction endonuclease n=1 Tax=Paenibacillus sp. ISL-20 TaxID=2819163 RepID=UPI001BEC039F|nr:HNH endonuclease [Paenibacillus sp. ISL-20]MBT2759932.1 HNH endonuclease [Paenibacillus sp. ISL-20]